MDLRDDTVMNWRIRQAGVEDLDAVSSVLHEAAQWLEQRGMALWLDSELAPDRIREEVEAGLFHVAEADGIIGGVIMFQLEDPEFWPDAVPGEAAHLHRLAVRRRFAGGQLSSLLLDWSREKHGGSAGNICEWTPRLRASSCARCTSDTAFATTRAQHGAIFGHPLPVSDRRREKEESKK